MARVGQLFDLTLHEKHVRGSLFGSSNPCRDIPRLLELYRTRQLKLEELTCTPASTCVD